MLVADTQMQRTFSGSAAVAGPAACALSKASRVTVSRHNGEERIAQLDPCSGTSIHYNQDQVRGSEHMAFLRRKGNAYYLVHNVRHKGKVKQLHLARLGERPRITDEVVRQVSRAHPLIDVNWSELREQVNGRVELFDPNSEYVQKLVATLRTLNLDLADLFPPLLDVSQSPEIGHEIITQLRLLQSTVQVKLNQFDLSHYRGVLASQRFR